VTLIISRFTFAALIIILESLSGAILGLLKESLSYQLLTALLFKKALRALSIESGKQIIFIFDQFEELFIFGTKEEKQSLVQVVKALVESDLDCRFIFIIREEYFANIAEFEKRLSLSEELTNLIGLSRETIYRTRTRKRNVLVSGGIIIILLLSVFSVWALKERNRAEGLNTKVLAEKYNLLATNIAVHDPTKGLRLAEYAYSLDSTNERILGNIKRIYSDNIFYTLIAKQEDAIAKQEDAISAVTFSPDSKYILTGSGDATARLFDLNGNIIKIFIGHSGYVNSVAFSPDGQTILTGSTDRSARLWDINGKVLMDFKGHRMSVNSVAFSPDGKEILTGSSDKTARLWDLEGNVWFFRFNCQAMEY
jgi:WD40 repeat protein